MSRKFPFDILKIESRKSLIPRSCANPLPVPKGITPNLLPAISTEFNILKKVPSPPHEIMLSKDTHFFTAVSISFSERVKIISA